MRHDADPPYFAIHEVYYNDDNIPNAWTRQEMGSAPFGESVDELVRDTENITKAFSLPVLDFATGKEIS